ncbi:hypothetical protein [Paenibacillus sp. FSL R7-0337]|uniref:hypothetical protein n=1 Tax=Paenibacillus sp. FSL R7-0337 TaxID=1926588 RepID=UPI00096ECD09|nr:hypothetical protein [Paenibacillus sp. FSL R7-0337]OMF88724.1 hypothetical protein BK147_26315 [Paenibacillus sp. FSL R7-0337]
MTKGKNALVKITIVIILTLSTFFQFSDVVIAKNNPIYSDVYNKLGTTEKLKLIKFLYKFTDLKEEYNINNYKERQIAEWLYNGIYDGKFRFEPELKVNTALKPIIKDFFYYPYPEKEVNNLLNRWMGLKLSKSNYNSEGIIYKNNNYYIISPERGSFEGQTVAQPHTIYPLGKNIYYVLFSVYSVEISSTEQAGLDYRLIFNPAETWSEKFKAKTFDEKEGYAVIEKVASGKSYDWKLLRYSAEGKGLSDLEIEEYLRK